MGESGAGSLMASVGVGAVLGSLAASLLVGTRRLGGWFAVGVALWGLPIALVGVFPAQAAALVLLAFVGVGNALIDLAGFTLIGRLTPDALMARVFGVLESLVAVSIGVGAIIASVMIAWLGVDGALVAIGMLCPVLALASWWRLRGLDRSVGALDAEVGLLQRVPMFQPLPLPAIEQLARGLEAGRGGAGQRGLHSGGPRRSLLRDRERPSRRAGRRSRDRDARRGRRDSARSRCSVARRERRRWSRARGSN